MTIRAKRLFVFFTLPATALVLSLAIGRYHENQLRDHRDAAVQVAHALAIGALLYADEHGGRLPAADRWEESLLPYLGSVPLTVPQTGAGSGRRFAMNLAMSARKLSELGRPAEVILFYESTSSTPDTADDLRSMLPREDPNRLVLVYADGHIDDTQPAAARDAVIGRSRGALEVVSAKPRSGR